MRRSLPGMNYELAAAVRRVNTLLAGLPSDLQPDVTSERWHELENELDRACGAGDHDAARQAISRWEHHSSQLLSRFALREAGWSDPPQRHNGSGKPETVDSDPPQESDVADRGSPAAATTSGRHVVSDREAASAGSGRIESLEDATLDPVRAEEIRAAVNGEWIDGPVEREPA